jgi:hypothetical protein
MEADERRRMEEAMAKISQMKREGEADPEGAVKASLDATKAELKRRLLRIFFVWVLLVALALAFWLLLRS